VDLFVYMGLGYFQFGICLLAVAMVVETKRAILELVWHYPLYSFTKARLVGIKLSYESDLGGCGDWSSPM